MSRTVNLLTTAALAAALAGGVVAAAGPASAADLRVVYDATGSTLVAKPKSTIALGPTTLTTDLNAADGSFTGSLPIPPTTSAFNVAGFIPAKATVSFIPAGPVSGKLTTSNATQKVAATAVYTIKLTDVTLGGIPTFVGDKCQTATPVTIPVATPAGKTFNITTGGVVTGTYTIGNFANCGLTTGIINSLVPGPNNTVSFTLSNGRISS